MSEENSAIEVLIEKAKKAETSLEAMQYTQAAINAAQALHLQNSLESDK